MLKPTLPALAQAIADHFEELGGRALAVSEVDAFDKDTNVPTLPICVVALVGEQGDGAHTPTIAKDILVQFVYKPVKYEREDGRDSPFFAFYDYETLRDRMLSLVLDWQSPRGQVLKYRSLDVDSDEFAVYIAMRFSMEGRWCQPDPLATQPYTVKMDVSLSNAWSPTCEDECKCNQDAEEPCDSVIKRGDNDQD